MARKKSDTAMFKMPSAQEQMSMALDHAVDKAVMCHPQTQQLRKQIAAEMKKATGAAGSKKPAAKKKA